LPSDTMAILAPTDERCAISPSILKEPDSGMKILASAPGSTYMSEPVLTKYALVPASAPVGRTPVIAVLAPVLVHTYPLLCLGIEKDSVLFSIASLEPRN